ncbi:MAG: EipA family protein [Pseudomonadota bacterium]
MFTRPIQARQSFSNLAVCLLAALAMMSMGTMASAQGVETFDPDEIFSVAGPNADSSSPGGSSGVGNGIDADLADPNADQAPFGQPTPAQPTYTVPQPVPVDQPSQTQVETSTQPGFDQEFDAYSAYGSAEQATSAAGETPAGPYPPEGAVQVAENSGTYGEDDLIGAAEGVFGKGAEGLARMIQDLLKDQGQPNGYIVGREAGGAFIFGARYGSGTLHHKIEGQRKVYWTGPSVGFDAGANAANTFILVYNLYDTQELFKRYAAGEGQAYLIGGLHASYVRRGDKVLIPIRMGVGARLGVNAGYLKFSEKQRWLPF